MCMVLMLMLLHVCSAMILNGAPYSTDADIARIMERVTEITLPYVKDTSHKGNVDIHEKSSCCSSPHV